MPSVTPFYTGITGNWGCGMFRGNLPLKFVIQWLTATLAGRGMIYHPFGDPLSRYYDVTSLATMSSLFITYANNQAPSLPSLLLYFI